MRLEIGHSTPLNYFSILPKHLRPKKNLPKIDGWMKKYLLQCCNLIDSMPFSKDIEVYKTKVNLKFRLIELTEDPLFV